MARHLRSKELVPFRKRRNSYKLPKMGKEEEERIIDAVDPNLKPDEQGFVRHYLGYADVFLGDEAEKTDRRGRPNGTSDATAEASPSDATKVA
jgi:hypothetical protein